LEAGYGTGCSTASEDRLPSVVLTLCRGTYDRLKQCPVVLTPLDFHSFVYCQMLLFAGPLQSPREKTAKCLILSPLTPEISVSWWLFGFLCLLFFRAAVPVSVSLSLSFVGKTGHLTMRSPFVIPRSLPRCMISRVLIRPSVPVYDGLEYIPGPSPSAVSCVLPCAADWS